MPVAGVAVPDRQIRTSPQSGRNANRAATVPLQMGCRPTAIAQLICPAAGMVLLGAAALMIDMPVARWIAADECPVALRKLCMLSEVFAHGLGVALILMAIYVLDPLRRRFLPRVICGAFGAGLIADLGKLILSRTRPLAFNLNQGIFESFGQWLPSFHLDSAQQGFPSAHTATAVGLAVMLSARYPRGRYLFPLLAALAAGQRIISRSHFLSDVLWGAAVGLMIGGIFQLPAVVRLFTWEANRHTPSDSLASGPDARAA